MTPRDRARALRHDATEAEQRLWRALRNRQLGELKFRRQFPVGNYIVDFACLAAKLVIEVDGDTHAFTEERDRARTACLEYEGFRVIRFSNTEIMGNMDGVLTRILTLASPHPSLSPEGRG